MYTKLLLLAGAGAAGTLTRYLASGMVQHYAGTAFPWGTLCVNVLGCFLGGLVWSLCEVRGVLSPETRTIILVGFMGAFTTFSAYALETQLLLQEGQWTRAAANLLVQNIAGLTAVLLGMAIARWVALT